VGSALLMAHQYMAKLGILGEDVIKGQDGSAQDAEDNLDTFPHQAFAYNLSSGHFHNLFHPLI
jgi:hypothetical protein